MTWAPDTSGVLTLPSGRRVRGRAVRPAPSVEDEPNLGLYLLGRQSEVPHVPWETIWIRWPDFRLPRDPEAAVRTLRTAWQRSAHGRVEIACSGGRGRTGTALAMLAVMDGVPSEQAIAFVRAHYHPRAVETRRQRLFVESLDAVTD